MENLVSFQGEAVSYQEVVGVVAVSCQEVAGVHPLSAEVVDECLVGVEYL